jgi:hypothetical protein
LTGPWAGRATRVSFRGVFWGSQGQAFIIGQPP